jgi:hypothetical protein
MSTGTGPARGAAGASHGHCEVQRAGGTASVRRDGDAIVIDIPMDLRRRSGRKELVLPPGMVGATATRVKPPAPLALALARAFRWQEMIESGQAESNSDLARRLKLDQSYIARTIRLTSLAPDLVEAILDGQEPDGLSLRSLRRDLPLSWHEQRRQLGDDGGKPRPASFRRSASA